MIKGTEMANAEQQPQQPATPPPPAPHEEKTVWDGSPSQLINLPLFLMCALVAGGLIGAAVWFREKQPGSLIIGAFAVFPLFIAFWRWLKTRSCRYHLTTERLQMSEGVFSRNTEDVELYRVKDYRLIEPFTMRLFGLADVVLNTMDEANPTVMLRAIPGGKNLRDEIRKHVELCRDRKRVRVAEFDS